MLLCYLSFKVDVLAFFFSGLFFLFLVQILPPPRRWPVTLQRQEQVTGPFHRGPDWSTVSSSTRWTSSWVATYLVCVSPRTPLEYRHTHTHFYLQAPLRATWLLKFDTAVHSSLVAVVVPSLSLSQRHTNTLMVDRDIFTFQDLRFGMHSWHQTWPRLS